MPDDKPQVPAAPAAGKEHKNDMYGNIDARSEDDAGVLPPIPAATVLLLRDGGDGIEVLMLKKNSKITFGGMWVFPGGKIDQEDGLGQGDDTAAAKRAAVREAEEEASLVLDAEDFVYFSHWTPPPGPSKRFSTWFFVANANDANHDVEIDQGEIKDHNWIVPSHALTRHADGEIDIVPPTWVTLYHLSQHESVAGFLTHVADREVVAYSTRVAKAESGVRVAMWAGDAGYDAWDADLAGPRHRLLMSQDGFQFENDVLSYR